MHETQLLDKRTTHLHKHTQSARPVYVLEGKIGDLMKTARLGPGDCVGVLK